MRKPALALLIVAAMLGGLVAIAGGVGAFLYLGANGLWSRKPTEDERKLIVTSNTLADYVKLDASCETLKAKRNIDGTREIEAEYEPEQCRAAEQVSFVSGAEISHSKRDARESFAMTIGAYKTGARIGGGTLREVPALLTLGDQHYAAEMHKGGDVVGNLFVVRQGRVVHGLFIAGFAFRERGEVHRLLEPLLQESARRYGASR